MTLPEAVLARLPTDAASTAALALAQRTLSAPLLNHSLRVYLHALRLAEAADTDTEWPGWWAAHASTHTSLLFIACICHDFGATDNHNGAQRFEVEGADAGKSHCLSHGMSPEDAHAVWCAIALHTTPGIAERIDPLSRLVRVGALCDFGTRESREAIMRGTYAYAVEIEGYLPRLEIERVLADAVVGQGLPCAAKADALPWPSTTKHPKGSWPGMLMRAHLENPGHVGWKEGENPAF